MSNTQWRVPYCIGLYGASYSCSDRTSITVLTVPLPAKIPAVWYVYDGPWKRCACLPALRGAHADPWVRRWTTSARRWLTHCALRTVAWVIEALRGRVHRSLQAWPALSWDRCEQGVSNHGGMTLKKGIDQTVTEQCSGIRSQHCTALYF